MILIHDDLDRPPSGPRAGRGAARDTGGRPWSVVVGFGGGATVVRVAGEATQECVLTLFFRCAQDALRSGGPAGPASRLVIDLRRVERADSKLMAYLVEIYRLARQSRAQVELRPSTFVRHLVNLYDLPFLRKCA